MSATRMAKRHPRLSAEDLPTTRKDVIAFADFLSTDQRYVRRLMESMEIIRTADAQAAKQQAIAAEYNRRQALPKWRRWMLHLWREW